MYVQDKLSVMAELVLERNNLIAGIVYGQLTIPTDKQLIKDLCHQYFNAPFHRSSTAMMAYAMKLSAKAIQHLHPG